MLTEKELLEHKAPWEIADQVEEYITALPDEHRHNLAIRSANNSPVMVGKEQDTPYAKHFAIRKGVPTAYLVDSDKPSFFIYLMAIKVIFANASFANDVTILVDCLAIEELSALTTPLPMFPLSFTTGYNVKNELVVKWFQRHGLTK